MIDQYYYAADFYARALVTMRSPLMKDDVRWHRSEEEIASEKQIRERLRLKVSPRCSFDDIVVDLARMAPRLPENLGEKETRKLLGWTSVSRSIEIISKYGKIFTRKPHDRRIAADEDRRNNERVIVGAEYVKVELGARGPVRKFIGSPTG